MGTRFSMMRNTAAQQNAARVQQHSRHNQADQYRVMSREMMDIVHWMLSLAHVGVKFQLPTNPAAAASPTEPTSADPQQQQNPTPSTLRCDSENAADDFSSFPFQASHFQSSHIAALIAVHYRSIEKYQTTNEDLDDVTFIMVRNNITIVQHEMDHVRYKRSKFLCINDDMDHEHENYPVVLGLMQELLRSYYPSPSSFELPEGQRNGFVRLPASYEARRFASADRVSSEDARATTTSGSNSDDSVFVSPSSSSMEQSPKSSNEKTKDASNSATSSSGELLERMRERLQVWVEDLLEFVLPDAEPQQAANRQGGRSRLLSETLSLVFVLAIVLGLLWFILDRYFRLVVERHILGQEVRRRFCCAKKK